MRSHNYYRYRRKRSFLEKLNRLPVVVWLIIANVTVYLFLIIGSIVTKGTLANGEIINYFLLTPASVLQGKYLPSLILHMFTHTRFWHLLVNMIVLYSLGSLCEKIIGNKRFFWFYILSGLFAGALTVLLSGFFGSSEIGEAIFGSPLIPGVGASGAIFAIAGLYVILLPRLKFTILFLPFFAFPAYILIPAVLFIMWGITIAVGLFTEGSFLIGNVAHFGGFLAGLAYGLYLRHKYKRKVFRLQRMFR